MPLYAINVILSLYGVGVQDLAREIFYATALALDYLHRKLIVHMYVALRLHHSPAQMRHSRNSTDEKRSTLPPSWSPQPSAISLSPLRCPFPCPLCAGT